MSQKDTASANLARRPDEEHYADMATLIRDAKGDKDAGRERRIPDNKVTFTSSDQVMLADEAHDLTPWLWSKVAEICRIPVNVLERLSPETRANALNDTWDRESNDVTNPRVWLIDRRTNAIRAVTSDRYTRIWDADIYTDLDRWVGGAGWVPAYPEINTDAKGTNIRGNTKPALFRGDRDSFAFYMSDREDDDGGDFGGLRRGITVWNSEVGARGIGFTTFYFRAMCANFLVWGMRDEHVVKGRHVGKSLWGKISEKIREIGTTITTEELDLFAIADNKPFIPGNPTKDTWVTDAADRVNAMKILPRHQVARMFEGDFMSRDRNMTANPGSHFHVANGFTDMAKELAHADQRMAVQSAAGVIMQKAVD